MPRRSGQGTAATSAVSTADARRVPTRAAADDRFFRHLVSSMRNGVIAIHRDGTLALANDEAYRIFALTRPGHDCGRPFTEIFRERPDLVRLLSAAFEMSALPNRAELRLKDLDRVIGYTLSQVADDRGRTIGAVMFFKDLTRVEQIEEQERLRDRLASLGEMAAGIAHELKNPLAGIEVMAGLLRRQVQHLPDAQTLLADIVSEAKLANAIVVDMLEFVRPVRLQLEPVDLREILQQAVAQARVQAARGESSVVLDVQPNLPPIEGDETQLAQVFMNLVTNAFEALEGRGRVAITASLIEVEPDPNFTGERQAPTFAVVVEVSDNGPGVPADVSDRIFNPFFTTKTTGSGLGLPIVRKIVDAHDGRIDFTSEPGQGTRFRVTLPVSTGARWFK